MSPSEWVVLTSGVAAIAWVNWYFLLADRGVAIAAKTLSATAGRSAPASVTITVKGGYSPGTIRAKAGQPLQIVFDRQETSGCSEEIVFPALGIKKFLPPFQLTVVEVTPPKPGKYAFTCGMSMLHGTLIAD